MPQSNNESKRTMKTAQVPAPCVFVHMCARAQGASGLGAEDAQMVVEAMAQTGTEATYCMGDDIPLSVLSDKPHPLYNYFKQRFAQVRGWRGCVRSCWDADAAGMLVAHACAFTCARSWVPVGRGPFSGLRHKSGFVSSNTDALHWVSPSHITVY